MKTRNYAIDSLRTIAAVLVVFIHVTQAYYMASRGYDFVNVLIGVARLAVPLFFAISGYLLFSNDVQKVIKQSKRQVYRIIQILALSIILYVVFNILTNSHHFILTGSEFLEVVLLNNTDFATGPLWFLGALVTVNAIFYIVLKTLKYVNAEKLLVITSVILFVALLMSDAYRSSLGINSLFFNLDVIHSWVYGLPFFVLGYFTAKYVSKRPPITTRILIPLAVFAGLTYAYEYFILSGHAGLRLGAVDYHIYLMMPILVVSALLIAGRYGTRESLTSRIGQKYSLYIFIIHFLVLTVTIWFINEVAKRTVDRAYEILAVWIVVTLISLGLSFVYVRLKPKVIELFKAKVLKQ